MGKTMRKIVHRNDGEQATEVPRREVDLRRLLDRTRLRDARARTDKRIARDEEYAARRACEVTYPLGGSVRAVAS